MEMLLDGTRTGAYARAIREVVRQGDVVLDLGSGSGILAILAAKAGARKVYAVERTPVAQLIEPHAKENGVAGVIEVLNADILDEKQFHLDIPPRVVIGELLGNFPPAEDQQRLYSTAVRHCVPDCVTIPLSYRFVFAACSPRCYRSLSRLNDISGVRLLSLAQELRKAHAYRRLTREELCGPEIPSRSIPITEEAPQTLHVSLPVTEQREVTAVMIGFQATLSAGVELASTPNHPPTHWLHVLCPVAEPLACSPGDAIDFTLHIGNATDERTWSWQARLAELKSRAG